MGRRKKPVEERLRDRIVEDGDCWLWSGGRLVDGDGLEVGPQRLAYRTYVGPLQRAESVVTTCGKHCLNPNHMRAVGIGQVSGAGKFTAEMVREIRVDTRSLRRIGLEYGVTGQAIKQIRDRKTYRWVD